MAERDQRQHRIREWLAERGKVTVDELAQRLDVTTMTIRRDLTALEGAGVLTRTHGGCVLRSPYVPELSYSEKEEQHPAQKLAIARAAVAQLRPGDAVYLDTGTTAMHAARLLPTGLNLRIFTNNLRAATELFPREDVQVVVYGGTLAHKNPDLTGELALARIREYRLDVALIGADAVDVASGEFYAAEPGTAALSHAAQQQAERRLLLADSSKFGKRGHALVGRLARGLTLITDHDASAADLQRLRTTGATLIVTK